MDCEWKPYFDMTNDELDESVVNSTAGAETETAPAEATSASEAPSTRSQANQVATFQLATRDFAFVIDTRFLIDKLSQAQIEKFGNLVLFSEKLVKLGKRHSPAFELQLNQAGPCSASFPTRIHLPTRCRQALQGFSHFEAQILTVFR